MKPKYSKRTVDEAVQLLDVYASGVPGRDWFGGLATELECAEVTYQLAAAAWTAVCFHGPRLDAAEAAQRLREGWRP